MRILDFVAGTAFAASLVALPFSFYYFRRKPILSALVFVIPLLICLGAGNTSQVFARAEVLDKLEALDGKYRIAVNRVSLSNPIDVLLALKTIRSLPSHHSSPTKRIDVEISNDSCHIALSLARDSGNPREYWVFYPKYHITTDNEIGRIVTPLLDDY